MIKHALICGALLFTMLSFSTLPANMEEVDFYQGSLKDAKKLAGLEGKLAFVEFHASWCGPCKWMNQTTFKHPEVVGELNENYVAIKVDIDDFDGFAWKKQYNVETLPTMLIFNSRGQLVDRIEETLSPSKMVEILKMHNSEPNKEVMATINTSPKELRSQKRRNSGSKAPSVDMTRRSQSSYKIQVGIFEDYESAVGYFQKLQEDFLEPIIVLNDYTNGAVRYKIMMGDFQSENEADSFRDILENEYEIKGFVQ